MEEQDLAYKMFHFTLLQFYVHTYLEDNIIKAENQPLLKLNAHLS